VVWSEVQWRAVDATVASIEAKALLRAAGQTTKSKGKVPPTDVLAVRPPKVKKSKLPIANVDSIDNIQTDVLYVPTTQVGNVSLLSISRSPETRRRAEALAFARDIDQGLSTEAVETTLSERGQPPTPTRVVDGECYPMTSEPDAAIQVASVIAATQAVVSVPGGTGGVHGY